MTPHPKRLKQKSLRHRLLLSMGAAFLVILTVISIGLWGYARQAANKAYDRLLHGAALSILERVSYSADQVRVDLPYSAFEILGLAMDDRVFYRIYTRENGTITASHDLPMAKNYEPAERPVYWDSQFSGEMVRFMQQSRLITEGERSFWVIAELGQTRIARNAMTADLFWRGLAVAVFITAVGLLFVWFGINRALHPLIYVERDLRKRDISDFTPLPVTPPREVASLVMSINSFITRLKNNLDHSQTFIADVTHQIRTALSALQGQLELATKETDSDALAVRINKAEQQSRNTIRLTNQLLAHAMVIHRADQKMMADFHLKDVLKNTLETILREHLKSNIEFTFDISPRIENGPEDADLLFGDHISIREALKNIIDNAIKHGPPDNHIRISLDLVGNDMVLEVADSGPGIAPDDREKVLERFYTTASDGENSGLGLSIVDEVARSHNAQLVLNQSDLGGLSVKLVFER
ncbi:two-component system, OmpR family, sensor histidine kinase TctE [Cohaesibacter sp. ES.047]|uniref:sensor histidine kinase n=1 Tax=Cohaesibacter sp. ES.047 TaxID=1798205 RepID=UPI000BB93F4E|nr:sensor histidine kinase [Cohaesibacter sp. ES.047]SNY93202.1 two-component system, OmpR family, sensor histidine kinase TctE [Cohaesibacter sp. ES.047]